MKTSALAAITLFTFAGCQGGIGFAPAGTRGRVMELDTVADPPANTSLLVLAAGADRPHVSDVIEKQLNGEVYHEEGTRLMVVRVPENADAALAQLGVAQRFERAVQDGEIAGTTLEESRFVRVFNNRYYPDAATAKFAVTRLARDPSQPFEEAPRAAAVTSGGFDMVTTPYASGTIVVALVLPESNGVAEPSTEDWTEDAIVATYQKVQTALEGIERSEPNANLRFILHYESSPANGGLPGTVDCDFEYGLHAGFGSSGTEQGGADEGTVSAALYAKILGHPVASDSDGAYEYLNNLREQYRADGGYVIKISPDLNGTAPFRAHATINGPWTSLTTDYGFETFMHESGHIFGALDEYCPDACVPPTAISGYLGAIDANSTYVVGGPGFTNGQGEDQQSLMQFNQPDDVDGYTRRAWGWADSDGDGILEVRDTLPQTIVKVSADAHGHLHIDGGVTDVPESPYFNTPRSFNHIAAVEWRFSDMANSSWFSVPLDVTSQSRIGETVPIDLDLGRVPPGKYDLLIRARNTVGNTDPQPVEATVVVSGPHGENPPRVALTSAKLTGSPRTQFHLTAIADDRDAGDLVKVRFDLDGDGDFDTLYSTTRTAVAKNLTPGVHHLQVEAKDLSGKTAIAGVDVVVLATDAPPQIDIAGGVGELFVADGMPLLTATGADPDGDAVQYDWIVDSATEDRPYHFETGFGAPATFQPQLATPLALVTTPVRLGRIFLGADGAGAPPPAQIGAGPNIALRSMLISPTVMVTAYGREGLYFTNVSDFANPTPMMHLILQTDARDLFLDGTKLFVLGESLTVVDVTDPTNPKELPQKSAVAASAADTQADSDPIPDGDAKNGVIHDHAIAPGVLSSLTVSFVIDHPAPQELRLTLDYLDQFNTQRELVLQDQVAGPAGQQTYTFTSDNGGPLAAMVGLVALPSVELHAMDVVGNGISGTLISTSVSSTTSTNAYLPANGAQVLAGAVSSGRYLALVGLGLEVVDTNKIDGLKKTASVSGTGAYGAVVTGSTVIALSPLAVKGGGGGGGGKATPVPATPATKGLYAVSLANPKKPAITRIDPIDTAGAGLFLVGDRLYFNQMIDDGSGRGGTVVPEIASASAFLAGGAYQIGALPDQFGGALFGDDSLIWTEANGQISSYDVHDPKAPVLVTQYFRPTPSMFQSLGGLHVSLAVGHDLFLASLGTVVNPVSRVYRVTLQARDASGLVGTAARNLFIQPYDHAPQIASVQVVSGQQAGDTFVVQVVATDPDSTTTWDPALSVRADLDGDGYYEIGWTPIPPGEPWDLSLVDAQSGHHHAHVQVRDTFAATADATLRIDVP